MSTTSAQPDPTSLTEPETPTAPVTWNADTLKSPPREGPCARCTMDVSVFDTPEGTRPKQLCVRCWSAFKEAREAGTFVDWSDAFDNATDEQLAEGLSGGAR